MSAQLDMFKPVQLDMRLDDAVTAVHLTDLEAEALAQVISLKAGPVRNRAQVNALLDAYHLDSDSRERVSANIPGVLPF